VELLATKMRLPSCFVYRFHQTDHTASLEGICTKAENKIAAYTRTIVDVAMNIAIYGQTTLLATDDALLAARRWVTVLGRFQMFTFFEYIRFANSEFVVGLLRICACF